MTICLESVGCVRCNISAASVVTDDGYVHGDGYRMAGELHDGFDDHGSELKSTLGGNIGVRPAIWVETSALS